jgi:hypothetical protein
MNALNINKQECLITLGNKGLSGTNTLAYWAFSKVMNVHNKLECLITVGSKGLPGTNTLAYWVNKLRKNEM